MTRTTYYTATSIDGFIADSENSLDWLLDLPPTDTRDERFAAFLAGVGVMVMGSTTYEWVVGHERMLDEPAAWQRAHGDRPCFVFTARVLPVVPGADIRFVRGDPALVQQQLRVAAGERDVWVVGGGDLAGQLADRGLLDEVLLGVAPVLLGAGAPLLPRRITSGLSLTSVERDGELVLLSYALGASRGAVWPCAWRPARRRRPLP